MNTNDNNEGSFSALIIPVTTLVFVILKLTHVVDWSWWWVLSPLWIPFAILLVIIIFALLIITWKE